MIGQLRHRIGLYTPEDVADELGGQSKNWLFRYALWAAVQPQALSETRQQDRLSVTQSFRVTIRYMPTFPAEARLVWRGRILRVVAASDPDTRGERLHLICEEVKS